MSISPVTAALCDDVANTLYIVSDRFASRARKSSTTGAWTPWTPTTSLSASVTANGTGSSTCRPSAGPGAPLMLLFHGFGGTGSREIVAVRDQADRHGVVVVAPDSRGQSWDIIVSGRFGPDVEFVDQLMAVVPQRYDIDPTRFAVSGISDGASYALCVGPRNDCTTIAFSPGFAFPGEGDARPRIFMSHGTRDPILAVREHPAHRRELHTSRLPAALPRVRRRPHRPPRGRRRRLRLVA